VERRAGGAWRGGAWRARRLASGARGAYHPLPSQSEVSIVASFPVGGLPVMGGPRAATRPYDLRRLSTPGIPRVRQAHRAVLPRAGFHVRPGWVAGGLLVGALLSTGMVAGSTGTAAPAGAEPRKLRPRGPTRLSPAWAHRDLAERSSPSRSPRCRAPPPAPTSSALLVPSGGVLRTEAPVRRPMLASVKTDPSATPRPRRDAPPLGRHPTPAATPHATRDVPSGDLLRDTASKGDAACHAACHAGPRPEVVGFHRSDPEATSFSHAEAGARDRLPASRLRARHLGRFRRAR
jgi:hypothetical protein